MDEVARFAAEIGSSDPGLDVALALITAAGRDCLTAEALLQGLDHLAATCDAADAVELHRELFDPARPGSFRGDTETYHDPGNSLLDGVLDRRRGIPITLSILAIEVGRRRGIELVGVGMPGHFLVRSASDEDLFFDPFHGGVALDRAGCRATHERLFGPARLSDEQLEPTPPRAVIARVLANLRHAYAQCSHRSGLATVLELQSVFPGADPARRRELADVLAADGRFDAAAEVREGLMHLDPERAQEHAQEAVRLRARMN